MEATLQQGSTSQCSWLSSTGTGGHGNPAAAREAAAYRPRDRITAELTYELVQSLGAGQSVVKRLVYVVAVWLLWCVWFIASLFLVGLIGPALGFTPVAPGRMLLVFDVVYEVSFVPFVLVALWRSRWFVTARGVSESTVENPFGRAKN